MKFLNQLLLTALIAATVFSACKKDEVETTPLTSISLVNAVYNGKSVKLGSNATTTAVNAYSQMAVVAGENNLYVWPVGDSLHPYYTNPKFVSQGGEVYSLFLTGTDVAPDAVTVKETIPYRTDSTAGIRFINLSPGSAPLDIVRKKTPTVNEVTGLAYKQFTDYKTYPGLYNSADTFLIKNAAGTQLASFNFTTSTQPRFANVTLVIRQNGASGVAVFRVNNDR